MPEENWLLSNSTEEFRAEERRAFNRGPQMERRTKVSLDERQRFHRVPAARHLRDADQYFNSYRQWVDPDETPRDLTTQELLAIGDSILLAVKSLSDAASEILTAAAISGPLFETPVSGEPS